MLGTEIFVRNPCKFQGCEIIRKYIPAFPFGVLHETAWIGNGYIENPKTIAEHLRNKRLKIGITQAKVAKMLNVSEDTITYWENSRVEPQIHMYPRIVEFLGYNPFPVDESTLSGRIRKFRIENGVTQEKLAEMIGVNESTIFSWEGNKHTPFSKKLKLLEEKMNQKELSK